VDRREVHWEAPMDDRKEAHWEGPMGDRKEAHLEAPMGGRREGPMGGHWVAPWWVRARKRAFLMLPQRAKVVRCHQTLRRACHRAGLVRLHHGTVLQKFSVSPFIHPYRPHGAA